MYRCFYCGQFVWVGHEQEPPMICPHCGNLTDWYVLKGGQSMIFTADGVKVHDPRDGKKKLSSNPALVFGYVVTSVLGGLVDDEFWEGIRKLANVCDKEE